MSATMCLPYVFRESRLQLSGISRNNWYSTEFHLHLFNFFLDFSAGIGRTGTFIVIDNLVKMIKEQGNVVNYMSAPEHVTSLGTLAKLSMEEWKIISTFLFQ